MKKFNLFILSLILLAGCSNTTELAKKNITLGNESAKIESKQSPKREENKIPFTQEVENLKVECNVENAKLSWNLGDKKNVAKIEIMTKQSISKSYKSVKVLDISQNESEISLPSFLEFDVKVRLISKDGLESNGVVLNKVITKMKNVVMDKYEGREMQIYLPEGYNTGTERYPVIYMHDGQNLFNQKTAPNGEWKIDETMDKLIAENKVEKMIVVGICNTGDRLDDYSPYIIGPLNPGQGGKADIFSEFVVKKIIPYIDEKYRTLPNRENRAVMGSSAGGLISFWMGMKYSDTFSMIGALSPILFAGNGKFLEELNNMEKKDMKIWIDMGSQEFDVGLCRHSIDILKKKGYVYGKDILYYEDNGAKHNEAAWAKRAAYPILMFKGKNQNPKFVDYNVEIENCEVDYLKNGKNFIIVDPIGEYDNGIKFTLYDGVKFTASGNAKFEEDIDLVFPDDSTYKVHITGNLVLNGEKEPEITVSFNGIDKKVIVNETTLKQKKK